MRRAPLFRTQGPTLLLGTLNCVARVSTCQTPGHRQTSRDWAWTAVHEAAEAGTSATCFLGTTNFSEAESLFTIASKVFHV